MLRSRIVALAGTIAAAAACTVFATSAASAAPAPEVSPSPACGLCWTPRAATVPANVGAQVGAAVVHFGF